MARAPISLGRNTGVSAYKPGLVERGYNALEDALTAAQVALRQSPTTARGYSQKVTNDLEGILGFKGVEESARRLTSAPRLDLRTLMDVLNVGSNLPIPGAAALRAPGKAVARSAERQVANLPSIDIPLPPKPLPTRALPAPKELPRLTHQPRTDADFTKDLQAFAEKYGVSRNPSVMMHGSPNPTIAEFDPYGRSGYGLFGQGTYLSDNPEVVLGYSKKGIHNAGPAAERTVYAVQQNVKNPIDMDGPADLTQWRGALERMGIEESLGDVTTNEQAYRLAEEAVRDSYDNLPKWEGAEMMQGLLEGMGFDGITHTGGGRVSASGPRHKVIIAFHPEQTKILGKTKAASPIWIDPKAIAKARGGLVEKYGV